MHTQYRDEEAPFLDFVIKAILQVESTLTDCYWTTVPESVRRALRLSQLDKLRYTIQPDGEVVLTRAAASDGDDPALGLAQGLPARGHTQNPVPLRGVDSGLAQRIKLLVGMRSDPP